VQRFMRRTKRVLLGIAVPLFCLASAELVRAESKRLAPAHQLLGNVPERPSQDWALATLLIGAVGVLLLLDKAVRHGQPTNNAALAGRASEAAQRQPKPTRSPPPQISQGKVANEGMNDAVGP
jgi:hypothetical protein